MRDESGVHGFRIPNREEAIPGAIEDVIARLRGSGLARTEDAAAAARVALLEVLTNAMEHGNRCRADLEVEIAFDLAGGRFGVTVTDQGDGFDPAKIEPSDPRGEARRGRGLGMIRALMGDDLELRGPSVTLWFGQERFP